MLTKCRQQKWEILDDYNIWDKIKSENRKHNDAAVRANYHPLVT